MKTLLSLAVLAVLLANSAMAQQPTPAMAQPRSAAQPTPVGTWRTFDDQTGRERGRVQIEEHDGILSGRVVSTVDPADATRRCERCTGARRGAPIIGLTIITGLHQEGDHWGGGEIIDPQNGNSYDCTLRLAAGGDKLVVRGFMAIALLGRSQTWIRAR